MKARETRKRTPTAKQLSEQLEATLRRLHLLSEKWRGHAAHKELAGAGDLDPEVCTLHNCAMDLDGLLSKAVRS